MVLHQPFAKILLAATPVLIRIAAYLATLAAPCAVAATGPHPEAPAIRPAAPAARPPADGARGEAPAAPSGPAVPETLAARLWEVTLHSQPEVARRGQPFELHVHLVWGSPTGDEVIVPGRPHHPGFELLGAGYRAHSTRDQPGGGYSVNASLIYRLVAVREGRLVLDSLGVMLVRGAARRVVRIAPTAMLVLPPVSLRPRIWNLLAFAAGACAFLAGWVLVVRRRPPPPDRAGTSPEERARARFEALRASGPGKGELKELLAFIRSEAVRRYGGAWTGSGEEAFRAWTAACRAPEIVRERVGALVNHLETRCYVPEDPDPAAWHHWIEETERLWRVEEALASAGRS